VEQKRHRNGQSPHLLFVRARFALKQIREHFTRNLAVLGNKEKFKKICVA
jgi:hypothetical protein